MLLSFVYALAFDPNFKNCLLVNKFNTEALVSALRAFVRALYVWTLGGDLYLAKASVKQNTQLTLYSEITK